MEQTKDEKSSMINDFKANKSDSTKAYKRSFKNHGSYAYRSILAQFMATAANSMTFLGVGMMVAVPTTVIGVLHNSKGELSLDDRQSSWFGSLMMLIQPAGCITAGILQNYIGRKTGMILMNIPELTSWILLYTATSTEMLYASVIMMGLSAGFMEAPGLAYIGEVTEPKIRGLMTSFANINVTVGMLVEFLLGSIFHWRTAVAISAIFPVISIILITLIPDSPVWLLSKGRKQEALQALCWLRGWVSEDIVRTEFEELCQYTTESKFSNIQESKKKTYEELPRSKGFIHANARSIVTPTHMKYTHWRLKVSDFFRAAIVRPFALIIGYEFFFHSAALSGFRPYMIEAFSALDMPVRPEWLAFISSAVMILGGLTCILTVKFLGKRKLSLISMMLCSVGCLSLGVYSYYKNEIHAPWIPMFLFCALYYSTNVGIGPIPWMLISEVFPVRGRSTGTGTSAALFYIIAFVFGKTYLDLQQLVGMHGCFILYGIGGFIGFVFLYIFLPETEGKTLAEIENFFTKKSKRNKNTILA